MGDKIIFKKCITKEELENNPELKNSKNGQQKIIKFFLKKEKNTLKQIRKQNIL